MTHQKIKQNKIDRHTHLLQSFVHCSGPLATGKKSQLFLTGFPLFKKNLYKFGLKKGHN